MEKYRRVEHMVAREVEADLFLASTKPGAIVRLNAHGSAIWRLLEHPHHYDELLDILAAAFPDAPRANLARDLDGFLSDLQKKGVIECR